MDGYMGMILMWPIPYVTDSTAACNGNTLQVNQNQALYSLIGNLYGGTTNQNFKLPSLVNRVAIGSINLGPGAVIGPNADIGGTGGVYLPTPTVNANGVLTASNLPGHTHPAIFTATTGNVPVTVAAPASTLAVTIPVASTAPSSAIPANLSGTVYLANTAGPPASRGPFQSSAGSGATLGNNVTGNPGGTFTGNVTTVTGGAVTVQPNTSTNPTAFTVTGQTAHVQLPPYLAINFLILTNGIYPVRQT